MGQIADFALDEPGVTLTPGQHRIFDEFEAGEFDTAVLQCGRRGGKSLLADLLVLFDVANRDYLRTMPVSVDGQTFRPAMSPGERRIAAIVSPSQRQSDAHIRTCLRLTRKSPLLSKMLVNETANELVYSNGSVIQSFPANASTIRGGEGWSVAVLDECAYFMDSTGGPASGDDVYEAVVPALAQFGSAGWLIAISTPRWRQGMFYRLTEQAKSGRFPGNYYVQMSTAEMNPGISTSWLETKREEDPDLFRRQYLAEFTDSEGAFFNAEHVRACVREAGILPPVDGVQYVGALDPAYAGDEFAMSIGYRDVGKRLVIVGVWTWRRHGHNATLDAVKAIADQYRLTELDTDQWCSKPIEEGLAERGIKANIKPWSNRTKFEIWSAFRVRVDTGLIELPGKDETTVAQVLDIEARPTSAGSGLKIGASGSGHDDRASVIAGIVQALTGKREVLTLGAVQTLGEINTRLLRTGPLPAPFGFGTTGQSSVQDPGDRDYNAALMASNPAGGGISTFSLHANFIAASPFADVHAWANLHNFSNNNPEQVDRMLEGRDPADVIHELDAALTRIGELSRPIPGAPSWKHVAPVLDDRKLLTLLSWMARQK